VRSIVGRFLEHHRIFFFGNGGDEKVYLSSADWMPRNLNERVELMFPIDDAEHISRIKETLNIMLKDNQKAYLMKSDGSYRRVDKRGKAVNSQEELYGFIHSITNLSDCSFNQIMKPLYRKQE